MNKYNSLYNDNIFEKEELDILGLLKEKKPMLSADFTIIYPLKKLATYYNLRIKEDINFRLLIKKELEEAIKYGKEGTMIRPCKWDNPVCLEKIEDDAKKCYNEIANI